MYIAPGQGRTTLWWQNFDVNRNSLSLCPFVDSLKKTSLKSDFFTLFYVFCFHMYIAPGRGRQPSGDKNFMTTERPFFFAHMLQISKWSLRNLILYTFLMILHMYIAPGQGQKTPWDRLLMSIESPYHFDHLLQVSNKSFLILIFYTFFNVFPHVSSPGARADNPLWTKFWCQQKGLVNLPICCKFQKNIFEVWFYTYFCLFLYMYIAPGQGQTTSWGSEFLF